MIYEEVIKIIQRWKDEARKNKASCLHDEKYGAANYCMGKEQALADVLDLLKTSDKINKPWEE